MPPSLPHPTTTTILGDLFDLSPLCRINLIARRERERKRERERERERIFRLDPITPSPPFIRAAAKGKRESLLGENGEKAAGERDDENTHCCCCNPVSSSSHSDDGCCCWNGIIATGIKLYWVTDTCGGGVGEGGIVKFLVDSQNTF
jgi:hypothetical protein